MPAPIVKDLDSAPLQAPGVRLRLGLFAACSLAAIPLAWVAVGPRQASELIKHGGYFYILTVFALFLVYASRVAAARRAVWAPWLRHPGWTAFSLAAATAFTLWADPFKHKILFDEYVLQGTAFHMHTTKEVGTVVRAYWLEGSWQPIDTFLDKRPYFFAFLVSLVHDLTGYRLANAFAVNIALTPVFVGLVYWLARQFASAPAAHLAVWLLTTMPLLAQNATSAGMELHNLTMLAVTMAAALLYLRAPDANRLSLLIASTVLLSQSRYESVIFVGSSAIVILIGWWRVSRIQLPWLAIVAPLLLVPYVWHNRVLSATPVLWQLREGETSRFSPVYLERNLESAADFLFNTTPELANSWYLSVLGGIALLWSAARLARRWRNLPQASASALVVAAFAAGILGNFVLLMFYYWAELDDVIASRFALPLCLLLALLVAGLTSERTRPGWPLPQLLGAGLAVWLFVCGVPAMAQRVYTDRNLVMQEVDWECEQLAREPGPVLFITNKSTLAFVTWRFPTILNSFAAQRAEQIRYHLGQDTFRSVIAAQALRPTSAKGDLGVDPEDLLPASFRLEPFAVKRFGGRWIRLSRVTIEPEARPAQ